MGLQGLVDADLGTLNLKPEAPSQEQYRIKCQQHPKTTARTLLGHPDSETARPVNPFVKGFLYMPGSVLLFSEQARQQLHD